MHTVGPLDATPTLSGDSQDFVYHFPPLLSVPLPSPSPSDSEGPAQPLSLPAANNTTPASPENSGVTVRVSCLKLDWTAAPHFPESHVRPGQADVLLGSDLVYDRKILNILVPTIKAILKEGKHDYSISLPYHVPIININRDQSFNVL